MNAQPYWLCSPSHDRRRLPQCTWLIRGYDCQHMLRSGAGNMSATTCSRRTGLMADPSSLVSPFSGSPVGFSISGACLDWASRKRQLLRHLQGKGPTSQLHIPSLLLRVVGGSHKVGSMLPGRVIKWDAVLSPIYWCSFVLPQAALTFRYCLSILMITSAGPCLVSPGSRVTSTPR
jgi:hypothetical protein